MSAKPSDVFFLVTNKNFSVRRKTLNDIVQRKSLNSRRVQGRYVKWQIIK